METLPEEVVPLPRWSPALRRAVIRVRPEYFTWSREQRERYAGVRPKKDFERLDAALCVELFGAKERTGRKSRPEEDHLTIAEQNVFNEAILPLTGIGEDSFYLNDVLPKRKTLSDFANLREFDESDFRFQEAMRRKEDATYAGKPYHGALYLAWARLFVDGVFTYATLSMGAGYLYSHLDEAASELIRTRIPHRYVPGKNHGKVEGDQWQWDERVDAAGQEGVLEELQRQVYAYLNERYHALLSASDARGTCGVYLVNTSVPDENNLHIVFSDTRALAAVRFPSFLRDCRVIERPAEELQRTAGREVGALTRLIQDKHEELLRTFDPKVVRLRKRLRIMVHKNAFDDVE